MSNEKISYHEYLNNCILYLNTRNIELEEKNSRFKNEKIVLLSTIAILSIAFILK